MAELLAPVDLCLPDGRINPQAVGWTRHPLHTSNLRGWGRRKRWEHWGLVTPRFIVGLTLSSLDYLGAYSIYLLDRRVDSEATWRSLEPLGRSVRLPERSGVGVARARSGGVTLEFAASAGGTRLRARAPGIRLEAVVANPAGHESLGVVVPWSARRFQYTVKDVGRPLAGTVTLGGQEHRFGRDGSFAVLDHGRGRWPYAIAWNWAAGYGEVAGRRVGLQFGGRWTDGTGTTEDALFLDGRLHRIESDVEWTYDRADWMAPWRIRSPRVEVTFAPFHERAERTNFVLVASEVHQCFGRFTGWVMDSTSHRIQVDGVLGWAEEARWRW